MKRPTRAVAAAILLLTSLGCSDADLRDARERTEDAVDAAGDAVVQANARLRGTLDDLGQELDGLETHVREAARTGRDEVEESLRAARDEYDRLTGLLKEADASGTDPAVGTELARLDARITALGLEVREGQDAFTSHARLALAELETEVRAMESTIREEVDETDDATEDALDQLEREIAGARADVMAVSEAPEEAFRQARASIIERVAALQFEVRSLGLRFDEEETGFYAP